MALSLHDGRTAVSLARETLEAHVRHKAPDRKDGRSGVFQERRGVFVTLNILEGKEKRLRGCIGYPLPVKPLGEAIKEVTVYASEDPRFPFPVGSEELERILVEVSVLTLPSELSAPRREDFPGKIRVGTDGLIISNRHSSGLLLPQVAPEQGWDQETFLEQACVKAGLPSGAWLDPSTKVEVFQAEIFSEVEPGGEITRSGPETGK